MCRVVDGQIDGRDGMKSHSIGRFRRCAFHVNPISSNNPRMTYVSFICNLLTAVLIELIFIVLYALDTCSYLV